MLAAVRARLDGGGGLVVIDGPAGIGKTAVLRAAVAEARARGVAAGLGTWDDDGAPLGAWHEALAAIAVPDTTTTTTRRPALDAGAVRGMLAAIAGPVLVALDDAHRADPRSRGVLRGLVRLGLPAGALVVVAARSGTAPRSWDDDLADLVRTEAVSRVTLAELDHEAVLALVRRRWGHLGPRAVAGLGELVVRRCGGHPLHLSALLAGLVDRPGEATCRRHVEGVPDAARALLAREVARLPAPTRRVLDALAVLRPVDLDVLAAVLESSAVSVTHALRPAMAAGLLVDDVEADRVRFRYDLLADVVSDTVPAVLRRRWHRAALAALPDTADPIEALRHVAGAGAGVGAGTPARARPTAHRGGTAAGAPSLLRGRA